MRKIKNFFIHLLGGHTGEDYRNAFKRGGYYTLLSVECEMRANYGKPPMEWCNNVWKYVNDLIGHYEDRRTSTEP